MQVLTVDVGTGTQDIYLYDSELDLENGYKLIVPSPTMIFYRRIHAATRAMFDAVGRHGLTFAACYEDRTIDLLVNHFTYAAVTDGYLLIFEKHFKRNFVHVRDVADCFVHCLANGAAMAGRTYNVGLDYRMPITAKMEGVLSATWAHRTPYYSGADNAEYQETEVYDQVGLNVGVTTGGWGIDAYVDNLLDDASSTFKYNRVVAVPLTWVTYVRPRTIVWGNPARVLRHIAVDDGGEK